MRKIVISFMILIFVVLVPALKAKEFKLIQKWNHGDQEIYQSLTTPLITEDNNIVALAGKGGSVLITPDRCSVFAPMGEGPNEIGLVSALSMYGRDIAFIHVENKLKIFTKKDSTYKEKEVKWLKRGYYSQVVRNATFIGNKWFLAGHLIQAVKKDKTNAMLLTVYNEKGVSIAQLIEKWFPANTSYGNMFYFIAVGKNSENRIFVLSENELKAYEISTDQLKVSKEWDLETPGFYKKMPEDFYTVKQYNGSRTFLSYIDEWKTSYSRITRAVVEDGYLVLQVRTCNEKLKKFALLFYDVKMLKLEKTIFIDDYFLGTRDGKYYFYANGNPGKDEGTDDCIINIYAFAEK